MSTTILSADSKTLSNAVPADDEKDAKQMATDAAEKVQEYALETSRIARENAQDAMSEVRDGFVKASDKAREITEKQPLMAVASALAVGVVVGMALSNRR